jgi:hypothetical protein
VWDVYFLLNWGGSSAAGTAIIVFKGAESNKSIFKITKYTADKLELASDNTNCALTKLTKLLSA